MHIAAMAVKADANSTIPAAKNGFIANGPLIRASYEGRSLAI
jgi:hypothetical protein